MARFTSAIQRELTRKIWREAQRQGVSASAYVDELADAAMDAFLTGKEVSQSGTGGSTVNFLVFKDWSGKDTLDLCDLMRPVFLVAGTSTPVASLEAALANVDPNDDVRSYYADFSRGMAHL